MRLRLPCSLVYCHLLRVIRLPGQHEFLVHLLLLRLRLSICSSLVALLQFLNSICIPERVEGVLDTAVGRRHIGDHGGLAVAREGVLEHLSEFAASEGRVLLLQVEGPDAFFESEQTLVDLGSIHLGLLLLVDGVGSSFTSR